MPIAVACSCGARLKVNDTAAGKRVKCPKCGSAVAVPEPEVLFEEVDEPAPPPAKRKPRVVDEDDAPPRKKKPLEVNEAVDDDEDEKPRKNRRRDDDEDDDEDDRPRKKGKKGKKAEKKSNLPLIIGVVVGVSVLLGVVGVIVALAMGGGDQAKGTPTTKQGPPPPPPLPAGWKRFQGEGFSVAVPDQVTLAEDPRITIRPQPPIVSGRVWAGAPANLPPAEQEVYTVTIFQLDPQQAPTLERNVNEMMSKPNTGGPSAPSFTETTLSGHKAWQMSQQLPGAMTTVRTMIRGTTQYTVTFGYTKAVVDDTRAKTFFDSFTIE